MTKIDLIYITYEEEEDENSPPVPKLFGIALTPLEHEIALKVNELITHHNKGEVITHA